MLKKKNITGWGKYPKLKGLKKTISSEAEITPFLKHEITFNPRGNGRSYGDSAIHSKVLETTGLSKILNFDTSSGLLHCEAGILLSDILEFCVPKGFFLPVTPGTKFVSLGGAIAADIHGKNHHTNGNLSNFVEQIELLTDSGKHTCSPSENLELFWATAGGMGLTGVILTATLRLTPIETAYIKQTSIKSNSLEESIKLIQETAHYSFSVAWIDCLKKGKGLGRSILHLGEHAKHTDLTPKQQKDPLKLHKAGKLNIPFNFPRFVLNKLSIWAFNWLYYHKQIRKTKHNVLHYDPYFYPLDGIHNWNKIYGKRGFIQYQFVLPPKNSTEGMTVILKKIAASGQASFLSVLKMFGPERKHNYLAFPKEGLQLALDIKMGKDTLTLMDDLDRLVQSYGGRIYLAKDARMKTAFLENSYPDLPAFKTVVAKYNKRSLFSSIQAERLNLTKESTKDITKHSKDLFMPNLLVLGANSDIAQATALLFAKKGYSLTLASRNMTTLNAFAETISTPVSTYSFDALDFKSHDAFYENLSIKPDVVICAFGLLIDEEQAASNKQSMLNVIQSNYTGAVSILNTVAEDFKHRKQGSIIGISSVAGDRGRSSNYHYGSSKAGFSAYLSGLRGLLRSEGVHIATIKPGFVRTKMIDGLETPGPLTASPEEVAKACFKSVRKRRSVVYTKPVWRPIMWIIKHIPEFIFKRLSI